MLEARNIGLGSQGLRGNPTTIPLLKNIAMKRQMICYCTHRQCLVQPSPEKLLVAVDGNQQSPQLHSIQKVRDSEAVSPREDAFIKPLKVQDP